MQMSQQQARKSRKHQSGASSSNPPAPAAASSPPPVPQERLQIRPPWPKAEHLKIRMRTNWEEDPRTETEQPACYNRPISNSWDEYDTLFYNAWLSVDIKPTRFIDLPTITAMGIRDDVLQILSTIGLGTMPTRQYDLYPDLVRQFLATCRVYYACERMKVAQEGVLTFMCKGVRYRISIPDLCSLYGFSREPTRAVLSSEWHDVPTFWSYIGTGVYESTERKQTEVRHPVLRYVLRSLGNSILCKSEPSKMRKTELILLYHGIGHIFPQTLWEWGEPSDDLNMGAFFANHVCTLKTKAFAYKKFETVGSLLTPIFRHFGVITDRDSVNTDRLIMDQAHLKNATWMKPGLNWVYTDSERRDWTIRLPLPALTAITEDVQYLTFQPDPSLLSAIPRRKLRVGASSRAPPSAAEDAMVDDLAGGPSPSLDFPEPPEGYDEDGPAFRRYMVSTMRQMWKMLASAVTCSRPPPQSRRRRRSPTPGPHATVADSDDDDSESF